MSGLLAFSESLSRSTIAMGVESSLSLLVFGLKAVSSKQMGKEESNSSTEGSQELSSSKGFCI